MSLLEPMARRLRRSVPEPVLRVIDGGPRLYDFERECPETDEVRIALEAEFNEALVRLYGTTSKGTTRCCGSVWPEHMPHCDESWPTCGTCTLRVPPHPRSVDSAGGIFHTGKCFEIGIGTARRAR